MTLFNPPTWPAFRALVLKDLRLWAGNRRAVIMGVLAPVLIASFFGYLFDSRNAGLSRIPVAITDLDNSPLSSQVLAGLKADPALDLRPLAEDAATQAVTQGDVRAAIVLPAGFGRQAPAALFGPGPKPALTVRYDPSQAMVLPMVRGLLAQQVMGPVFSSLASGAANDTVLQPLRDAVAGGNPGAPAMLADLSSVLASVERLQRRTAEAGGAASAASAATAASGAAPGPAAGFNLPFTTTEVAATGKLGSNYNSYAHAFAGMSVQFILLTGIDFGIGLLLARRMGLWQRLQAAPIGRGVLLGSRIASAALISLGILLAVFAVGAALFGVRIEGSVTGFLAVAVAFALLAASFGLLVAALGKTPDGTRGLAILVTLLMVMLGGAWAPSFIFPPWLQMLSLATPTRWAVDALDAVTWRAQGLAQVAPQIGLLLGCSVVFTLLALWRFDRGQPA